MFIFSKLHNAIKQVCLVACVLLLIDAHAKKASAIETEKTSTLHGGALDGERPRVLVSTDIGGTDPDDFQSMVHLLLYADVLDIEGLISSPYGPGRKEHILEVIKAYESDYANLKSHSDTYPHPERLRAITKQGEIRRAPYAGIRRPTEGSDWMIHCAQRDDPRPLHVLVWGGIEDLAQALHDAPNVLSKLRVYWIGGPNKKWSPDAYQYLVEAHPSLWFIESNSTYRGWFLGGKQSGQWGNKAFADHRIAGKGALGKLFISKKAEIKMGDTPSLGWLLKGTPQDPTQPSWGGRYVGTAQRPYARFDRLTSEDDRIEVFGILDLVLSLNQNFPKAPTAMLNVENQSIAGHVHEDGTLRFRFSPKAAKTYQFTISSNVRLLDGEKAAITAVPQLAVRPNKHAVQHPNWWTDITAKECAEGEHCGAKTVSHWRKDFLRDFRERMLRCESPASPPVIP